jgi:hypothetical protein
MSGVTPLWFSATFSVDPRFLAPGRELTVKVANSLGYTADDAATIGTGVGDAMSRAVALAEGTKLDRVQLTFRTLADRLEVTVLCVNGSDTETRLVRRAAPRLETELGAGMDLVELADEGGASYCRMAKALPERK